MIGEIISSEVKEAVLVRIHLYAALRTIAYLPQFDSESSAYLTTPWTICFKVAHGPRASLTMGCQDIAYSQTIPDGAALSLTFFSDQQINNLFLNRGFALPWISGWLSLRHLPRFIKLTKRLKVFLEPSSHDLNDIGFRAIHTQLTLVTAVAAIQALAEADPTSRNIISKLPSGSLQFQIKETGFKTALRVEKGEVYFCDSPPKNPTALLTFSSLSHAFDVLQDRADVLALVGKGEVVVEGSIPLADQINHVMERIRLFMPQPPVRK